MEVNPSFFAKTVPEFIAYAKANPGKINMATAGPGSMLDVYGQLFKMLAGVEMVSVPYRGSPALPDVPPLADFLPGYDASTWLGLGAPKDTPPDIVDKLNKEINTALAD